jgi:hypothetical protein
LERSVKGRAIELLNDENGTLVYIDTPWEDITQRLLSTIDVLRGEIEDLHKPVRVPKRRRTA